MHFYYSDSRTCCDGLGSVISRKAWRGGSVKYSLGKDDNRIAGDDLIYSSGSGHWTRF